MSKKYSHEQMVLFIPIPIVKSLCTLFATYVGHRAALRSRTINHMIASQFHTVQFLNGFVVVNFANSQHYNFAGLELSCTNFNRTNFISFQENVSTYSAQCFETDFPSIWLNENSQRRIGEISVELLLNNIDSPIMWISLKLKKLRCDKHGLCYLMLLKDVVDVRNRKTPG